MPSEDVLSSTERPRCCETWDVIIDPDVVILSDFCLLLIELAFYHLSFLAYEIIFYTDQADVI